MRTGSRKMTVDKIKLIEQIKLNRDNHVIEYKEAVSAYKAEALKQLNGQIIEAEKGNLDVRISLTSPINAEKNYNDIIQMFEWDVLGEVELEQNEFREYVQDETSFAVSAKLSNSLYAG